MTRGIYIFAISVIMFFQSCGLKSAKEVGLHFSTEQSRLPDFLNWQEIGFAKELIRVC